LAIVRLFTVKEATRTLPYVKVIVAEVKERYAQLREQGQRHNESPRDDERTRNNLKEEIRLHAARIRECSEELEAIGAQLKDYENGLVDFPSEFEGRRMLLCWEFGEAAIEYWHYEDEGYLGRKPVPEGAKQWPLSAAPAGRA
jgi:hypothetical protein